MSKKNLSEFGKRKDRSSGVTSNCKVCRSDAEKKRYIAKREDVLAYRKRYYNENKERLKARQREYNITGANVRREYLKANRCRINKLRRERIANDPVYALRDRLRRRLNYALATKGFSKNGKTEKILGCSWKEFYKHIEANFKKGMTWENRGEWEIDHIVPYASAKTEDEIYKLSHYTNLQPLWMSENRSKSDTVLNRELKRLLLDR